MKSMGGKGKGDEGGDEGFDDGLVLCGKCGRRFAEKTAERHIPICKGSNPLRKRE